MAFFKATAQDGLARCGLLVTKQGSITTPTPMLYTRRGGCLFLTPDMIDKLRPEAQLLQINTMQYIAMPGPEVLRAFSRSIHHYMGMPGWPVFACNRDPTLAEYVSTKPSNNAGAYVTIHTGGASVTPERYMQTIAALQPDVFVALADEVPGDARAKRLAQSVDRTIKWLDECIAWQKAASSQVAHKQQQQQQLGQQQPDQQQLVDAAAAEQGGGQAVAHMFAPVVGGASEQERQRSARASAERPVAGFALCGFGFGEPASARPRLLAAAMQQLPTDKPKLVAGLVSPMDVLEAVAQGADLFDCSYPTHATANGYALCFPLTQQAEQQHQQQHAEQQDAAGAVDAAQGADDSKMNLWSLEYRMDKRPLVAGCSCFTCANHTRAYLHHLLHTHEMLASVLLELHNTHWWLGFFSALQDAIQGGTLQQYRVWFVQRRHDAQSLLPTAGSVDAGVPAQPGWQQRQQ